MNTKSKIFSSGIMVLVFIMLVPGCAKKLDEHPYTTFTTEFFKTPQGLQSAVNTLYAGMKFIYGPEANLSINIMGTDEYTGGDQVIVSTGGQYVRSFALYGGPTPILSTDGTLQGLWNNTFQYINLANAVINYAPAASMDDGLRKQYMAEAHFLRGLYYMLLVNQFGAVPVDLGSGDLQFNQAAYRGFNRLPVTDILRKDFECITNDFKYASENLPEKRPGNAFRLSKAAAFTMLARAYVFKGYSSMKESSDFQNAYNAAMEVINNQAKYGVALMQNYGDVHRQGNDYNAEILYSVERLPMDNATNMVVTVTDPTDANNAASVDFAPNYTGVTSQKSPGTHRQAWYGRPYRRFAPTAWLLDVAFEDTYNDSRFDNSFRIMWYTDQGTDGSAINYGDTSFVLAKTQRMYDSLVALGRPYRVVKRSEFWNAQTNNAQCIWPYLKKYEDSLKVNYNDVASGRPFPVAKFSETYLLAAEAAMQLAKTGTGGAAELINVLKLRAAYRPGLSSTEIDNRYQAIKVSDSQVTIDFILDERTRELCGESMRFADLAMRGKLVERVKKYNPDGGPYIQDFHALRPIPQKQLERMDDLDWAKYQNPGYN